MPGKLLGISMTAELWCLVATELCLNIAAVFIWQRHRRVPHRRHKTYLLAIQAAVPSAAVLAVGAGAFRTWFPVSGPPSATARDLAIGMLTMLHAVWLWIPSMIVPVLADASVRASLTTPPNKALEQTKAGPAD